MATFSHISGAEPSTITFKAATVTQTRNSSVMHQEIISLGDPDTSNALAAVLNAAPASTAWGIVTREVGSRFNIGSTAADNAVVISGNSTAVQGTNPWTIAGNSTVIQGTSPWTIAGNSTVVQGTSPWIVSGASTVAQASTVWAVQMSQYSTTVQVSSVGGIVANRPMSTLWASSAGFHFDSSGALQITGASASTAVAVAPQSTAASGYLPVRISDGSTWVVDYLNGSTFTSTAVGGGASFLRAGASSVSSSDVFILPWGSTMGHTLIALTDSSQAVVYPADSANNALRVNVVAGSAASTTVQVSSVGGRVGVMPFSTSWASSAGFHFDSSGALSIAGSITANTSTGPLTVTQLLDSSGGSIAAGDSVNSALRVNVVAGAAGGSTIVTVSAFGSGLISSAVQAGGSSALTVRNVWSSTNTDQPVSAAQAGTWSVTASNFSTIVSVAAMPANSSLVQVNAFAAGYLSSVAPSSGSSGLIVRPVIDTILTVASTNAFASTSLTIQSSAAGIRTYVTAYSILSTNAGPSKVKFYDGSSMIWPVMFAAVSSAVSGANLAVSAPAYLFRGSADNAMTLQVASSVAGFQVAVSYFRAP